MTQTNPRPHEAGLLKAAALMREAAGHYEDAGRSLPEAAVKALKFGNAAMADATRAIAQAGEALAADLLGEAHQ